MWERWDFQRLWCSPNIYYRKRYNLFLMLSLWMSWIYTYFDAELLSHCAQVVKEYIWILFCCYDKVPESKWWIWNGNWFGSQFGSTALASGYQRVKASLLYHNMIEDITGKTEHAHLTFPLIKLPLPLCESYLNDCLIPVTFQRPSASVCHQ